HPFHRSERGYGAEQAAGATGAGGPGEPEPRELHALALGRQRTDRSAKGLGVGNRQVHPGGTFLKAAQVAGGGEGRARGDEEGFEHAHAAEQAGIGPARGPEVAVAPHRDRLPGGRAHRPPPATMFNKRRALSSVSAHSPSGSESAVMPAPVPTFRRSEERRGGGEG